MDKQPHLVDLIVTWMKKELPKAKFENVRSERDGPMNGSPWRKTFTIMKGKRPCFKVEVADLSMSDAEAYMRIFTDYMHLEEQATIYKDRVKFGKWNKEAEVLAADPEFFEKMTMHMTTAAMVVTMGDFHPNYNYGHYELEI